MQGQHKRLPDSGNGKHISPLSPFPPVQSQTHEPTEETEKEKQRLGKQKTETEGGKAGVEQERTEETEGDEGPTNAPARFRKWQITEGDEATLRDALETITRVRSSPRFWSVSAPACTLYISLHRASRSALMALITLARSSCTSAPTHRPFTFVLLRQECVTALTLGW